MEMESERYSTSSINAVLAHEAEWIIPGSFVVLQGSPGDGMSNTMECCPDIPDSVPTRRRLPTTIDSAPATVASASAVVTPPHSAAAFRSSSFTAAPTLGSLATSSLHRTELYASQPNTDAAAIVTDDTQDDSWSSPVRKKRSTNNNNNHDISLELESCLLDWELDCRQATRIQRQEWKESVVQMCVAPHHHVMMSTSAVRSSNTTPACTEWWQQDGRLALFRGLPAKLHNGTVLRSVMGTVSPGTVMVATGIVYLDSKSFERLPVLPSSRVGSGIYPRGRAGWIVLLKVEHEGRSGYVVLSLDGYPLLAPGMPSLYLDPHVWVWRVTCPAGAYVRDGLDLSSLHFDTLPYGSLVRVTRRTVNGQGLSRLRIHAFLDDEMTHGDIDDDGDDNHSRERMQISHGPRVVDGWCSELLSPLSGNRGSVLVPLSFPVPALYRVTLSVGAVIRSQVELSSEKLGVAPMGTLLKVVGRAFSEHPFDRCIERLKLAGNAGWISVRLNRPPPHDDLVVELVGVDGGFDPDAPGLYHVQAVQEVDAAGTNSGDDLSSVDSNTTPDAMIPQTKKPSRYRRSKSTPVDSGEGNHRSENNCCLICLTEARNATIVHGETGHIACCLVCARILQARGDRCPVCRLSIDKVIQHFWA